LYPAGSAIRLKVPPVPWPPFLVTPIVVIVSGATFAALELETTTMLVFVDVVAGVEVSVGAVNEIDAASTLKFSVLLVPPGVVTLTVLRV
jgi:hypothetical protein